MYLINSIKTKTNHKIGLFRFPPVYDKMRSYSLTKTVVPASAVKDGGVLALMQIKDLRVNLS